MGNQPVKVDPKGNILPQWNLVYLKYVNRGDETKQKNDGKSSEEDRKGESQGWDEWEKVNQGNLKAC